MMLIRLTRLTRADRGASEYGMLFLGGSLAASRVADRTTTRFPRRGLRDPPARSAATPRPCPSSAGCVTPWTWPEPTPLAGERWMRRHAPRLGAARARAGAVPHDQPPARAPVAAPGPRIQRWACRLRYRAGLNAQVISKLAGQIVARSCHDGDCDASSDGHVGPGPGGRGRSRPRWSGVTPEGMSSLGGRRDIRIRSGGVCRDYTHIVHAVLRRRAAAACRLRWLEQHLDRVHAGADRHAGARCQDGHRDRRRQEPDHPHG